MYKSTIIAAIFAISVNSNAQTVIPLYSGKVPNSIEHAEQEVKNVNTSGQIRYAQVTQPTLKYIAPRQGNQMELL